MNKIKDFITYRRGVIEGYKNLKYKKPSEYCIVIRWFLNDLRRRLYNGISSYEMVRNNNTELRERNEILEKENDFLRKKLLCVIKKLKNQ